MRLTFILATAAAAAALSGAAHAASYTVSVDSTDAYALPAGEQSIINFDTPNTAPYAFDAATLVTNGSTSGVAAAPYLVTEDTTNYGYVLGGSSSTLSLSGGVSALSLLWGSVDGYNSLAFFDGSTQVGATLTGSAILDPSNGYQFQGGSALVNVNFSSPVDRVVFSSSSNSFEFDNIAVAAAPEPGMWALMLGGIGLLGGMLRMGRAARREDNAMGALA